jgi:chlorite dismutase
MEPLRSEEGWCVSHLLYRVDLGRWAELDESEKARCKDRLSSIVSAFRQAEDCQINCYSVWGLKADVAFMLISPDLDHLNRTEYDITSSLTPGVLEPVDSFISMSEISEYVSQDKDYDRRLREKEGLAPESAVYQQRMKEFRSRMQGYINERLYPKLPEHRLMCFYPMTKSRSSDANWYLLTFDDRKRYMAGHAITGRKFRETVKQLITGSIGLDDWEWGVTLFSNDPVHFKRILYEMRYDEASAKFGEFGPFFVGLRMSSEELMERVGL